MSLEAVSGVALVLEVWSVLVVAEEEEVVVVVSEALVRLLMAILDYFLLMVFVWEILPWQKKRICIADMAMPVVE